MLLRNGQVNMLLHVVLLSLSSFFIVSADEHSHTVSRAAYILFSLHYTQEMHGI